jgi:hypothetical protein
MLKLLLFLTLVQSSLTFAVIEDNSFLIEEAYNQDSGVYQFIQMYQATKQDDYEFSSEMPLTDRVHQLSLDLSMRRSDKNVQELNETKLNYRWQPINREIILVADRLGLVAPVGQGSYGIENVLASTWKINEIWVNHWNIGYRLHPDKNAFLLAGSMIYLLSDKFNVLFETMLKKDEVTTLQINPGIRFDIGDQFEETQIIPGISLPIQILNGQQAAGILLYLSFEPKFK